MLRGDAGSGRALRTKTAMTHAVVHFEIECDDVERARRFYESVFGWKIRPWGPPNYYLIDPMTAGLHGDLRERKNLGA